MLELNSPNGYIHFSRRAAEYRRPGINLANYNGYESADAQG